MEADECAFDLLSSTIAGFISTSIASTLWFLSMGQYANERNIDGAFKKQKRNVFSKKIEWGSGP